MLVSLVSHEAKMILNLNLTHSALSYQGLSHELRYRDVIGIWCYRNVKHALQYICEQEQYFYDAQYIMILIFADVCLKKYHYSCVASQIKEYK